MSMPFMKEVVVPAVAGNEGAEVRIDQLAPGGKGYDFERDVGAGFTGVLEGSVTGNHWTTIVTLAASGQGAIPTHYNYVRANVSVAGVLGVMTKLIVGGVVQ